MYEKIVLGEDRRILAGKGQGKRITCMVFCGMVVAMAGMNCTHRCLHVCTISWTRLGSFISRDSLPE